MEHGITIKILWFDSDVLQLLVTATSARFSGYAELYAGHRIFSDLASMFRGFPTSPTDTRETELGTFDSAFAGGGARFRLSTDATGHTEIEVTMRSDTMARGRTETANFIVQVEPNAIDDFVMHSAPCRLELAGWLNCARSLRGKMHLRGLPDTRCSGPALALLASFIWW